MNIYGEGNHYMCRACMRRDDAAVSTEAGITQDEHLHLQSIYAYPVEAQGVMNIAELLCSTTPQLEIHELDGLPKMICSQCLVKLLELQQFQEMCRRSDKQMRSLYELSVAEDVSKMNECNKLTLTTPPAKILISTAKAKSRRLHTTFVIDEFDDEALVEEVGDVIECVEIGNDPLLNANSTLSATSCDSITDVVAMEEQRNITPHKLSSVLHSDNESTRHAGDDYNVGDIVVFDNHHDLGICNVNDVDNDDDDEDDNENEYHYDVDDNALTKVGCLALATSEKRNRNKKAAGNEQNKLGARTCRLNVQRPDIPCPVCGKYFRGKYRIRRHMQVHDALGRPYACSKCEYRFTTHGRLKGHETEVHSVEEKTTTATLTVKLERIMESPTLAKIATAAPPPTEELELASTEATLTSYPCNMCALVLGNADALERHREQHILGKTEKELRFSCDLHGATFQTVHMLTNHKRTHRRNANTNVESRSRSTTPASAPPPPTTTATAASSVSITEHDELKPFICKFCTKGFPLYSTLKEHERTHTSERPYLCSECGKSFTSSSNMKQHLMRHMGVKRYECPDCPKRFPCASDLASHKAVHKNYKPHVCETCGAGFGKPYQLKKHKMYHNNERPHKCDYCEMRFVCADHMRRHMRTHTGEKPYKCRYCERAFAQSNDLIKHLRSHLGENVYKCELCPAGFRLAAELRIHFAKHKFDDEPTRQRHMRALLEEETKLKKKFQIVQSNAATSDKHTFFTMQPAHRQNLT